MLADDLKSGLRLPTLLWLSQLRNHLDCFLLICRRVFFVSFSLALFVVFLFPNEDLHDGCVGWSFVVFLLDTSTVVAFGSGFCFVHSGYLFSLVWFEDR